MKTDREIAKAATPGEMKNGDYVLATKYSDGDPKDPFAIGFFDGMLGDRYLVVDNNDKQFRASGFRRIDKISKYVGEILIRNIGLIENGDASVWFWRRNIKSLLELENKYLIRKNPRSA